MTDSQSNSERIAWVVWLGRIHGLTGLVETGFGLMILLFGSGPGTASWIFGLVFCGLGAGNLKLWRSLEKPLTIWSLRALCLMIVVNGYSLRLIRWTQPWDWMYHVVAPLLVLMAISGLVHWRLSKRVCAPVDDGELPS
jgi:hypothetical protein